MKVFSFMSAVGLMSLSVANASFSQEQVFEEPYWTKNPVIEVLGRVTLEVPPNRAQFSVEFRETSAKSGDAMQKAVERARIAYETVKKIAGNDARVTSSVSIDPFYKQYRDKDGDRIENTREDKVEGYAATATLNITVLNIEKSGAARAAALALAPEQSSRLQVYLERTAEVNRNAYEAAVADAAKRARLSADATGANLGKLLVLQEGNGPCLGRWTSQPGRVRQLLKNTSAAPKMFAQDESVMVTGARLKNGKQITITQADIDALNIPSDQIPQTVTANVCAVYAIGQ